MDDLKIKLYTVTMDCKDPYELAKFYAALLKWDIPYHNEDWACGATIAGEQFSQDWRVMLDPAGHPFCLGPMKSMFESKCLAVNMRPGRSSPVGSSPFGTTRERRKHHEHTEPVRI